MVGCGVCGMRVDLRKVKGLKCKTDTTDEGAAGDRTLHTFVVEIKDLTTGKNNLMTIGTVASCSTGT